MEQTDKRKESTPATPAKKQKTGEPPERECMEDVQFVLDNDYVPLSNKPLNAKMKTEDTWGKNFLRGRFDDTMSAFDEIFSQNLFRELCVIANEKRYEKISCGEISDSCLKRYSKFSENDMKRFYATVIFLENRKCVETPTIEEIITRSDFPGKMGIKRYFAILSCLQPTNEEFNNIRKHLVAAYQSGWSGTGVIACDETIYEYHTSSKSKKRSRRPI